MASPIKAPASSETSPISSEPPTKVRLLCTICRETVSLPRSDGLVEKASILPCSHVFGNICIQRWLDNDSLHQDCPICRRRMVYRVCGHTLRPCEIERASKSLLGERVPEKCLRCRGNGELESYCRGKSERKAAERVALEGLRTHLPGMFGALCRTTVQSVDGRIEELRVDWEKEVDKTFAEFEQQQERVQW